MSAPPPTWRIIEYRGRAGIERLEDDWRRLYSAMPQRTAFHTYEANLAYVDHLMAHPNRLRCIALSDGGVVRAICLLEARTTTQLGLPVPVWGLPWHPHWPLADVICPEDDARRAFLPTLVRHLRRHVEGRPLLVVGPLPEDSVLWVGVQQLGSQECCLDEPQTVHVLDSSKSYDELHARLPKKFLANLRRARNKLEALPDVHFVTATEQADASSALETFLDIEASGWKRATGSAIKLDDSLVAFYRQLVSSLRGDARCEISSLFANGQCIASEFGMAAGDEYAGLKMGYDENHSGLSPGLLLLDWRLEQCCLNPNLRRFCLTSAAAWHGPWRPDVVNMSQGYVAISRLSSLSVIALLKLRFGPARRLVRSLRGSRKTRLDGSTHHGANDGSRAAR